MNYVVIVYPRSGGAFCLTFSGDLVPCVTHGTTPTIPYVPAAALGSALEGIIDNENYRRIEIIDVEEWNSDV